MPQNSAIPVIVIVSMVCLLLCDNPRPLSVRSHGKPFAVCHPAAHDTHAVSTALSICRFGLLLRQVHKAFKR